MWKEKKSSFSPETCINSLSVEISLEREMISQCKNNSDGWLKAQAFCSFLTNQALKNSKILSASQKLASGLSVCTCAPWKAELILEGGLCPKSQTFCIQYWMSWVHESRCTKCTWKCSVPGEVQKLTLDTLSECHIGDTAESARCCPLASYSYGSMFELGIDVGTLVHQVYCSDVYCIY